MRSDGTGVRKIWNDTFNSSIGWAPDSKRLAFVSGGDEPLGMHVEGLGSAVVEPNDDVLGHCFLSDG